MKSGTRKLPIWLTLGVAAVVLLTACSALLGGGAFPSPLDEEGVAALLDDEIAAELLGDSHRKQMRRSGAEAEPAQSESGRQESAQEKQGQIK